MGRDVHGEALRQVCRLFEAGAVGRLTDAQLLERFRAREGEAAEWAFAALVERHGPMVWRVCRRSLRDEHDAEDAFQATFLVLVRRADTLEVRAQCSLGGWLYGVAGRVSACARASRARRRAHERRAAQRTPPPPASPSPAEDREDLGRLLHEELARLPATYRAAVLLCDLEGLTQDQAAQRLGWPPGTVRSRLARGRRRLQGRLSRRGLAPSAGALATWLSAEAATAGAGVPPALVDATVRAGILAATGRSIVGAVPAAALAENALRATLMSKLAWIATIVLSIAAAAGGTAVLALQPERGPEGVPVDPGATSQGSRNEPIPPAPPAPPAPEAIPPQVAPRPPEDALTQAEARRKRAEERLEWSKRMYQKGYLSRGQYRVDQEAFQQAVAEERRVRSQRNPQSPGAPPGVGPQLEASPRPVDQTLRDLGKAPTRADLNRTNPRGLFDDAELVGLPRGSQPPVLDWKRVYALALMGDGLADLSTRVSVAQAPDMPSLAEQLAQLPAGDFARFRQSFLSSHADGTQDVGKGRDPAGEVLDLLCRRQRIENARWHVAGFENLVRALSKLIQEANTGFSQLELDQVDGSLQKARLRLLDERERFRDRFDTLKVRLGLSPHAPVALDKESLAGFRATFEELDRWCSDPERELTELPRIARRLPELADVVIEGVSLTAIIRDSQFSEREERLTTAAVRIALGRKPRVDGGDTPAALELRVRSTIRHLLDIAVAYAIAQRQFVLVTRQHDQAQERLLAPPRIATLRPEESPDEGARLIKSLVESQEQATENHDRLVALWTEYQSLRLDLFRDLGIFPYDDWESFYEHLTARPAASIQ
jgi:RNA polymerase sigma factor (sigma-70 family)